MFNNLYIKEVKKNRYAVCICHNRIRSPYIDKHKTANQIQVMPVQVKHMPTLCRHDIKEKKKERSILFPLISLTLLAISGT